MQKVERTKKRWNYSTSDHVFVMNWGSKLVSRQEKLTWPQVRERGIVTLLSKHGGNTSFFLGEMFHTIGEDKAREFIKGLLRVRAMRNTTRRLEVTFNRVMSVMMRRRKRRNRWM